MQICQAPESTLITGVFDEYGLKKGTYKIFQGQKFKGEFQCDWFLEGTFVFKAGFQFKAKYGWNVEKKQDHSFDVEQPVEKQFTFNGKLVHDWEVSLQRKRLAKMNKEKRLFQTNELDLGGMNKSKAKKRVTGRPQAQRVVFDRAHLFDRFAECELGNELEAELLGDTEVEL